MEAVNAVVQKVWDVVQLSGVQYVAPAGPLVNSYEQPTSNANVDPSRCHQRTTSLVFTITPVPNLHATALQVSSLRDKYNASICQPFHVRDHIATKLQPRSFHIVRPSSPHRCYLTKAHCMSKSKAWSLHNSTGSTCANVLEGHTVCIAIRKHT